MYIEIFLDIGAENSEILNSSLNPDYCKICQLCKHNASVSF